VITWALISEQKVFKFLAVIFEYKFKVMVSWFVMPCGDVVGYQCFGVPCCLHLQGNNKALKMSEIVLVIQAE
jgi:hypothetical protein